MKIDRYRPMLNNAWLYPFPTRTKMECAIVKLGMAHGLVLPMNSYLVQRIKEIEGPYVFSENTT